MNDLQNITFNEVTFDPCSPLASTSFLKFNSSPVVLFTHGIKTIKSAADDDVEANCEQNFTT